MYQMHGIKIDDEGKKQIMIVATQDTAQNIGKPN